MLCASGADRQSHGCWRASTRRPSLTAPHSEDGYRPCPAHLPPTPCSQLVILLDFIYIVNEWLLDREWHWAMIIATALLICGSIVGTGFLYKVLESPTSTTEIPWWNCAVQPRRVEPKWACWLRKGRAS